ncbi:MAG: hypothetical protein Q4F21_12530 [Lachnospiraceae bacterium]|nr:hypothetical protein [Lachnospiraceae bacterium]
MNGYSFQWRMAGRRKEACLLVLLFTAMMTVFLLSYPRLIDDTCERLDEAYANIEVKGWMLNTQDYADPYIPGSAWNILLNSGYFKEYASYKEISSCIFKKEELDGRSGGDSGDQARLAAMQLLLDEDIDAGEDMRGYNSLKACDELIRIQDSIQWLEGYSADCLESDERICLLPERLGYAPGEVVPILVRDGLDGIIRLKVAGVYPGTIVGFSCVIPLKTMEQLYKDAAETYQSMGSDLKLEFSVNSFVFTIADNHQLPEVKKLLTDMGYDGNGNVRAVIDDRILQGTISPIKSNLALLEGLYPFFFIMVTAIGFFLCFLLARGRRPEYAVMRMLGESQMQVTIKALAEQSILCLCGIIPGTVIVVLTGFGRWSLLLSGSILLCYTLGAAVAVLLTVNVNVMEILQDKE